MNSAGAMRKGWEEWGGGAEVSECTLHLAHSKLYITHCKKILTQFPVSRHRDSIQPSSLMAHEGFV